MNKNDKYCFVTIDTEEDEWGSIGILNPSVTNIAHLVKFQKKCNEYNIIPTYLINYPVATSGSSRDVLELLLKEGKCEIGMHCHPWNTPPIIEEQNNFNSFLCNLPNELVEEKLIFLHEVITKNFGITPTVFRAGRWGMGDNVLPALEKLNYKVDTSITPFHSWKNMDGPDFQCKNTRPFYLSQCSFPYNITGDNTGSILEIPPTMGYLQTNEAMCDTIRKLLVSPPWKFMKLNGMTDILRVINYRWLSPETSTGREMIGLANRQFAKGLNFIHMFFHSNSLMSGKTPFVTNEDELTKFYERLTLFFQYVKENDIKSIPLSFGADVCHTDH